MFVSQLISGKDKTLSENGCLLRKWIEAFYSEIIRQMFAKCLPSYKNTPSRYLESVFLCPGRESNPHGRFGPRDFKSLVSTISPPGRGGVPRRGRNGLQR